ncbi:MAG: phosphotransferase [Eubacterium sp.]|nr:phosphotransferase [Eubacterium sp.]
MRAISVDNCPVIGKGVFGTVYRLEEDKVVKVANDIHRKGTRERLEYEDKVARVLYENGIPTAQSFGLVEVGDSLGVIYELVEGMELYDYLEEYPDRADEMIRAVADILLALHQTVPQEDGLLRMKDKLTGLLMAGKGSLSEEEFAAKKKVYDALPERDTLVHGDLNPGNIIVRPDDSPVLIDVGSISVGHPYFEFTNMQQPIMMLEGIDYGWDELVAHMMKTTRIADREAFLRQTELLKSFYDKLFAAYFRELESAERNRVIDNLKNKAFPKALTFYERMPLPDEEKKQEVVRRLKSDNEKKQSAIGPVEEWWPAGY